MRTLSLSRIIDNVKVGTTLNSVNFDSDHYQTFNFTYGKLKKKPRIIYQVVDFLNKDPKDFVVSSQKKNIKIIKNMKILQSLNWIRSDENLQVYQLILLTM